MTYVFHKGWGWIHLVDFLLFTSATFLLFIFLCIKLRLKKGIYPKESNYFPLRVISQASAAFGRLRGCIWDQSGIRLDTKLKVYRSVVLPTLLYECETWTVYQRHAKRLDHFHTSCLRELLKIKWQDRIPDTEVLKRAGIQSVHTLLKLAQLRWTGHVTRMPDERLPKKILYGELQVGKHSHGGQKKRYKDTLKASLRLQHTNRVVGTDCSRLNKVTRPHKKGCW